MDALFATEELEAANPQAKAYTVLARKYRPHNLDGLIGQEALVRTLRNAIATNRIAHAYLLTGIRGVGKTTTARIMARVLNNIPDDQAVDSHIDVIEMDAASHTGVDNIREIIEEAKYKPLTAPYKIYIIDEVHMLSKGAFNALLKTLEEPPAHVKFIFATTEIRKVPVTILSRCQRFDLRRVDADVLVSHLRSISTQENLDVDDAALNIIAAVAEGSVRDSLSLLDQSIAYCEGKITAAKIQEMLGFADKSQIIALFENLMEGKIAPALEIFSSVCSTSAEPLQVFTDLLEFCHLVTRVKISPELKPAHVTEAELAAAQSFSQKLGMPLLSRIWQMLLKAQNEIKVVSNPKQAAEMALVRIAYSTELPDPTDLIRDLKKNLKPSQPNINSSGSISQQSPANTPINAQNPNNFAEVAELFRKKGEFLIHNSIKTEVHLVSFKPEQLELRIKPEAPKDLAHKIGNLLNQWTGKRWLVVVSGAEGAPTLAEQEMQNKADLISEARNHELVRQFFNYFPDAEIKDIIYNTPITKESKL